MIARGTWKGYAVFYKGALALWDAQCPVYWKRHIAAQAAEEHGLIGAKIRRVVMVVDVKRKENRAGRGRLRA